MADIFLRVLPPVTGQPPTERDVRRMNHHPASTERVFGGLRHLADNIHRVPAFVIPGVAGRTDHARWPYRRGRGVGAQA